MPLIECTLIKGYDSEARQRLAERVTDAACSSIGAAADFCVVRTAQRVGERRTAHARSPRKCCSMRFRLFCIFEVSARAAMSYCCCKRMPSVIVL